MVVPPLHAYKTINLYINLIISFKVLNSLWMGPSRFSRTPAILNSWNGVWVKKSNSLGVLEKPSMKTWKMIQVPSFETQIVHEIKENDFMQRNLRNDVGVVSNCELHFLEWNEPLISIWTGMLINKSAALVSQEPVTHDSSTTNHCIPQVFCLVRSVTNWILFFPGLGDG